MATALAADAARQPGADPRRRARRRRCRWRDKVVHRRRRLRHGRLRRLGRATDRRVHRQGRHRAPARRRRGGRRTRDPLARATTCCRPTRPPDDDWPADPAVPGRGRRTTRRADAALGVRHGRRRPGARDQPVRPARRRERQEGRPRPARRPPRTRSRRPSSTAWSRCAAPPACSTASTRCRGAVDALLAHLPASGYLAVMAYLDREGDDGARRRAATAGDALPSAR